MKGTGPSVAGVEAHDVAVLQVPQDADFPLSPGVQTPGAQQLEGEEAPFTHHLVDDAVAPEPSSATTWYSPTVSPRTGKVKGAFSTGGASFMTAEVSTAPHARSRGGPRSAHSSSGRSRWTFRMRLSELHLAGGPAAQHAHRLPQLRGQVALGRGRVHREGATSAGGSASSTSADRPSTRARLPQRGDGGHHVAALDAAVDVGGDAAACDLGLGESQPRALGPPLPRPVAWTRGARCAHRGRARPFRGADSCAFGVPGGVASSLTRRAEARWGRRHHAGARCVVDAHRQQGIERRAWQRWREVLRPHGVGHECSARCLSCLGRFRPISPCAQGRRRASHRRGRRRAARLAGALQRANGGPVKENPSSVLASTPSARHSCSSVGRLGSSRPRSRRPYTSVATPTRSAASDCVSPAF